MSFVHPQTQVVNLRHCGPAGYDVYVGRACRGCPKGAITLFGNPHPVGKGCKLCGGMIHDSASALAAFERYFYERLASDPAFKVAVLSLRGKRIACWCHPDACHADIIATYLDCYSEENPP